MHLELLIYASPEKIKEIEKKLNDWKYPAEGTLRRGHHAPFVSEVRLFDIRIKKEFAAEFLRDIQASTGQEYIHNKRRVPGRAFISMIMRMINRFTPLKKVTVATGPMKFKMKPFHYAFCLGAVDDPEQKVFMQDKKREIL